MVLASCQPPGPINFWTLRLEFWNVAATMFYTLTHNKNLQVLLKKSDIGKIQKTQEKVTEHTQNKTKKNWYRVNKRIICYESKHQNFADLSLLLAG